VSFRQLRGSRFFREPTLDEVARLLRQIHEVHTDFVVRIVSPGDAAPRFEMLADFRHFEIDHEIFTRRLRAHNIQSRAAFTHIIQNAIAVRAIEDDVETRTDGMPLVGAAIICLRIESAATVS
jgi:hypothetical protein